MNTKNTLNGCLIRKDNHDERMEGKLIVES
jgi:hypothetical protein